MNHLELGSLTTELVSVLATQSGLPVGDGVSPAPDEPAVDDYPYVVVYDISQMEAPELGPGAASTGTAEWQFTCVGLTRLQAARARDFCYVLLDPAIAVETASARLLARYTAMSTMQPGDAGRSWSAVWRMRGVVTAV